MSLYSVKYMDYNVRQKIGPWNTTDMEMTHKEWVTKVNKNIDLTRSTFDKKKKKKTTNIQWTCKNRGQLKNIITRKINGKRDKERPKDITKGSPSWWHDRKPQQNGWTTLRMKIYGKE